MEELHSPQGCPPSTRFELPSSETNGQSGDGLVRPPLFASIEQLGNPATPEDEKLATVFDAGTLLGELGVNPHLATEINEASEQLRPLNALTLARKPDDNELSEFEGRGAYHTNIPAGNTAATVYVKGTGSERAFDQPSGEFPGFPSTDDDLFYDSLSFSHHPRILGTETVRWGLMEAVNASYVFAHVAREQDWHRLSDAVDAGVTVPLNVLHFKELSSYLGNVLEQRRAGEVHALDERGLQWPGNDQLGSVSMIVPGNRRIMSASSSPEGSMDQFVDPNVAKVSGRTLRTLLDAGFCYSLSSSHGQNLYAEGLVAQADNSDLVSLGDYTGRDAASPESQRSVLLIYQFGSRRFLTPSHVPMITEQSSTTWEQTMEAQKAFWGELLQDVADPDALERTLHYLPLMRKEFITAAASMLVQSHDASYWEQTAAHKQEVLARYEASYGVLSEYRAKVDNNLHRLDALQYEISDLISTGKVRSLPVQRYLTTGDERYLLQDPLLGKAIALMEAVEAVPDHNKRDELLADCAHVFEVADLHDIAVSPDLATAFEGRHYDLLRELITEGRLDDAKHVLGAFALATSGSMSSYDSFAEIGEKNKHRFPRLLLEDDASYETIYQEARFEENLLDISNLAHNSGQTGMGLVRRLMNNEDITELYKVSEAAKAEGLPIPLAVIESVLASYASRPADRDVINDWIENYSQKVRDLATYDEQSLHGNMADVWTELSNMADNAGYPELEFAHHCFAAGWFVERDPGQADAHYTHAMDYYREYYERRAALALRSPATWLNRYKEGESQERRRAVAARYQELGLPLVAARYAHAV